MLSIYNSMSGRKESFVPITPGKVRMYVCGITVYDYLHLGHARMMIVFDMVVRYMRSVGLEVEYVRNITDIDDKIIERANEQGVEIGELTAKFIEEMHRDADALGVLRPDHEPRATDHLDAIVAMIAELERRGLAYRGDNGDVYYAVARFADYGKLSRKNLADLRAGSRIDVAESKRDPLDFVLWKAAKPDEPQWESPWGPGRPGWHIECSAMSTEMLGNTFDIHGGGMDLKFPHHENEIAQSCGATGADFARLWMHNGFVRVDEEKMSKSLGNFFTVRDILTRFQPEEVRFLMLGSHYRKPLNYSEQELISAGAALDGYYTALARVEPGELPRDEDFTARFRECMDDDFNSPGALAVLADLRRELSRVLDAGDNARGAALAALLRQLGGVLGILQDNPTGWLRRPKLGTSQAQDALDDAAIDALIEQREQARAARNWAEADRIRDELKSAGIALEDGAGGTGWRRI
ncbi:MAG: cysteine--tRNA ligase [Chromatiales bacterium]|jgi:cysteinyl-tRNA synthetase|nr:cysteine--tRNA ligase [Chromatiales bacterium]MDH3932414.1 cysteine--tRNA ligase [Chromatiales bacterium]MDH4012819.1 cysteine--tRNA ligase [Chromatiales bacterium]